jgi:hypothetical protein
MNEELPEPIDVGELRSYPTTGERLTGSAGMPLADSLTRGVWSGALLEIAALAGLDPGAIIADYPSLFAIALLVSWGIVDAGLKFAAGRGFKVGGS